jgi:ribosomal-protein-alanine N-acetyltransferase
VDAQWPVELTHDDVRLRPLKRSDKAAWYDLRRRNVAWLKRWDATLPMADKTVPVTYSAMIRHLRKEGKAGRSLSLGIEFQGHLVGQVTLGGIAWGSLRSAYIGYWIDEQFAGRGIVPLAVAIVSDHAFDALSLHRLEINLRTENVASRRVVEKLGFGYEGLREQYLHIDGQWRDHLCYVLLQGQLSDGVVAQITTDGGQRGD